jgi:hypothetical protein
MASTFPIAVVIISLLLLSAFCTASRTRVGNARSRELDHSKGDGDHSKADDDRSTVDNDCLEAVQLGRMESDKLCRKECSSKMDICSVAMAAIGGLVGFLIGLCSNPSSYTEGKVIPSTLRFPTRAEDYSSEGFPVIPLTPLGVALKAEAMAERRSTTQVRNECACRGGCACRNATHM